MVGKIRATGAEVVVGGANWNEADGFCRQALQRDPTAAYVPPFDDPLIWDGNSSIIHEMLESDAESLPDAYIVSVGGGGLLSGILQGILQTKQSQSARVYALETQGAASFAAAKEAGKVVRISKIDTIATSLGALAVTPSTLIEGVRCDSIVVSDKAAVTACVSFANENRLLVEPACGAALSMVYDEALLRRLFEDGVRKACIVVCGGSAVSLSLLENWRAKFLSD